MVTLLEEHLGLAPDVFLAELAALLGYPTLSMDEVNGMDPGFELISLPEALARECLPLRRTEGSLLIAIADPFDASLRAWAEERTDQPIEWALTHVSTIAAYLGRFEESARAMDSILVNGATDATALDGDLLSLQTISGDTSPVVKLVNSTLYDALKSNTSDIHIETTAQGLSIKYRLDGVLVPVTSLPGMEFAEQVISRIKVMAELDIAERRIPQDGRFKVSLKGRSVDFRVSVMPSSHGEDIVLRILDKQALADQVQGLRLSHLGFDESVIDRMRQLAREPYGMLLVTGPTGSGKTTTLYAAMSEINDGLAKIVTIEDPVEYQLPGILQIPVNEKKGLTFARGLRSILRHDPDKILVGEIRDSETAQVAVQAALTGHLVFTTVHANSVFDVIGRLMHMGVDPYSFVSAINGVLAQRLVRRLCPACAIEAKPDAALIAAAGIPASERKHYHFRAAKGCEQCRGTGYKGRKALGEVLHLNDETREIIIRRDPIRVLREAAVKNGTRLLRDAALDLVREGETTLEEINRVTTTG